MLKSTLQSWVGAWKELKQWLFFKSDGPPSGIKEAGFYYDTSTKKPMYNNGDKNVSFGVEFVSSGVSSYPGPSFVDNGSGSITMGACKARLYDNPNFVGEPLEYDIPSKTFQLTDGYDTMVVASYNNGTPEYKTVNAWDITSYNLSDNVIVYRFWYAFGGVHSASLDSTGLGLTEKQALRIGQTDYYRRVGNVGLVLGELPTRTVTITPATMWAGPIQQPVDSFSSATNTFEYIYKNSSNVWVAVDATQWPNTYYNPVSGLASLTNISKWSVLYIYRTIGDTIESYAVLDTDEYNSEETAKSNSKVRSDLPFIIQSHCVLVGRIVFKNGSTSGSIQSAWDTVFQGASVSDHELLSNLLGGDATGHVHLIPTTAVKVEAYGQANGMVVSDSNNYIPVSQIPMSLLGAVRYQGTWNASTNTPTLVQPPDASTKGFYYITSVAGTFNSVTYNVSDWIISDGTGWQKIDNTDAVTSVAGRTGAVVLTKSDVGLGDVDNTSDANKPISTATQTALNAKAPTNHASSATTYGVGDASNYGHVKVDATPTDDSTNAVSSNGVYDALTGKESIKPSINIYSTVNTWLNGGIFFSLPKSSQFQERTSHLRVFCSGGTNQVDQYTADVFIAIKVQGGALSYRVSLYNGSGAYGRIRYRLDQDANWWFITVAAYVPAYNTIYVSVIDGDIPSSFTTQTTTEPTGLIDARMDNVLFQSTTGNYGTVETISSNGAYAGVSVPGVKRLVLMSSVDSEALGLYNETDSKWMLLRYPAGIEGITTDYPPPSNASGDQIATAGWVRGRLADTTVGNADKVDGKHIVVQSYNTAHNDGSAIYLLY